MHRNKLNGLRTHTHTAGVFCSQKYVYSAAFVCKFIHWICHFAILWITIFLQMQISSMKCAIPCYQHKWHNLFIQIIRKYSFLIMFIKRISHWITLNEFEWCIVMIMVESWFEFHLNLSSNRADSTENEPGRLPTGRWRKKQNELCIEMPALSIEWWMSIVSDAVAEGCRKVTNSQWN